MPSRELRLAADHTGMLEIGGCELLTGEQSVGAQPFIIANPIKTTDRLGRLNIALSLDPNNSAVDCSRNIAIAGEGRYGRLQVVAGICRVVDVEVQPVFEKRQATEVSLSQEVLVSSIEDAASSLVRAVHMQNTDDQNSLKWLEDFFDYGRSYGNAYLAFHAKCSERKRELQGRMHFVSGPEPPHYLEELRAHIASFGRASEEAYEYVRTLAS